VLANPIGDGDVQEFHLQGAGLQIASIEFGDPAIRDSKRFAYIFPKSPARNFTHQDRPFFCPSKSARCISSRESCTLQLGPPEVRLTGNPNQKLPQQIPVYVPIVAGPCYHWKDIRWDANSALSDLTLTS